MHHRNDNYLSAGCGILLDRRRDADIVSCMAPSKHTGPVAMDIQRWPFGQLPFQQALENLCSVDTPLQHALPGVRGHHDTRRILRDVPDQPELHRPGQAERERLVSHTYQNYRSMGGLWQARSKLPVQSTLNTPPSTRRARPSETSVSTS